MLKANGLTTVLLFHNYEAIVEAAKQHKINVFVVDAPPAIYFLNKLGIEAEFRRSPPINLGEFHRAVRKGDAALLRTVAEGFAAIEPAELKHIDEKWLGRALPGGRYVTYAGYAAALALVLIACLAAWNRSPRTMILHRTAALRESEQRFRQLAENIHEAFWLTDPVEQTVLYVSPAYEDIWGRTCASVYASPMRWLEAIHPDDRERVRRAAMTTQATGTYDEEFRIVRPDDSIRWIRDRAFPVRNPAGEVYRIAGMAEDITERKRTEDERTDSERRFREMLENVELIAMTLDKNGAVTSRADDPEGKSRSPRAPRRRIAGDESRHRSRAADSHLQPPAATGAPTNPTAARRGRKPQAVARDHPFDHRVRHVARDGCAHGARRRDPNPPSPDEPRNQRLARDEGPHWAASSEAGEMCDRCGACGHAAGAAAGRLRARVRQ
jgi:PAS domain S-box-containing protein